MMDEQTAICLNDLINIVNEQNEALIKLLDKLDEFDRRLKVLEYKEIINECMDL